MSDLRFLEVRSLPETMLAGQRMTMTYSENRTAELWRNFMKEYRSAGLTENKILYSVEIYEAEFFTDFSVDNKFVKWAAIEVPDNASRPDDIQLTDGLEKFLIPAGAYAVFHYKGSAADAAKVFGYIYGEWLPASDYTLDQRPHFQKLGDSYRNNDENSEEEIWIPVKTHH